MKEKVKCNKCKEFHYCDAHHLLPKGIFGKGETVYLCKNCHDELHRFIGFKFLRKKNAQSEDFYLEKYAIWIVSAFVIGAFLVSQLLVAL